MPARHTRSVALATALLLSVVTPASASAPPPTFTVVDFLPGLDPSYAMDSSNTVALGDWIYFGSNGYLYRSNGPTTEMVHAHDDGPPDQLLSFDGWVYYSAGDATHGRELWRTNGDTTQLIDDINPGIGESDPIPLQGTLDGSLYFRANNGTDGYELWRLDTATLMVGMVDDINTTDGSYPDYPAVLGGFVYFTATDGVNGDELWRTDGVGAELVQDLNVGAGSSSTYYKKSLGDWLYFTADDGTSGVELWRTNGSSTAQVMDVCPGGGGSDPTGFVVMGDWLYFTADDCTHGRELWRTNGTTTGLVDETATGASGGNPRGKTLFNGWLYFDAASVDTGSELWRSDGSTVELVEDINTTAAGDSGYPEDFVAVGDWLYFKAYNGSQWGIWRTTGTTTEAVPFPDAGQSINCDCFGGNISTAGGKLFTTVWSETIGYEFAWLTEPTYVLPETSRDSSPRAIALLTLAALIAAAAVHRRRTELIVR